MSLRNAFAMFVLGCCLGLYEATVATFFRGMGAYVLPVLPCVVLCVVRERMPYALICSVVAGLVIDLLSVETQTFAVGRFMLIALFLVFISRTVLTNQSLYTAMVMATIARILDRLWIVVASWMHGWMSLPEILRVSWQSEWRILIADTMIVAIVFICMTLVTRRFFVRRPYSQTYA